MGGLGDIEEGGSNALGGYKWRSKWGGYLSALWRYITGLLSIYVCRAAFGKAAEK